MSAPHNMLLPRELPVKRTRRKFKSTAKKISRANNAKKPSVIFLSLRKIARSANHATLQRPNLTNDVTRKNFTALRRQRHNKPSPALPRASLNRAKIVLLRPYICVRIAQNMRHVATSLILFTISLAIFSFQADVIGLEFKGDENFYFQSSRQMVESGDWITPYYFDKARFEKPILYYWLIAIPFKFFGINWMVARLPAAISMALIVVLVYLFGLRLFNDKVGILSSLVVMTTLATFRYARLVLPESFFVFLLSASLYLLLFRKWYLLAYLLIGLAVLTKGPVGLILPFFIMAGYRYSIREREFFKDIKIFPYILVTFLVSLPWFLLMVNIHGEPYLDHIFFRETIERIGGLGPNWLKTLSYFIPVIFIFYLPWSLVIVPSIRNNAGSIAKGDPGRSGAVFSFIWFFAIFIFFTFIGEKHRHYILALCVPFGLMVGNYLHKSFISKNTKAIGIFMTFLLSFFIFESLQLAIAREIGGIGSLFLNRSYNIEKSDVVGIGSHAIVPQEVEVYVNHPVKRFYFKWADKKEGDFETMRTLNFKLFKKSASSFLVIKKSGFLKFIKPETKKRLTILAKGYMYSKGVSPASIFKAIAKFDKKAFLDLFREEVWFVTSKREYIKEGI